MYNRGFLANFGEVIFPLCDRSGSDGRGGGFATWPLPVRKQSKGKDAVKEGGQGEDAKDDAESKTDTKKER